MKREEHAPENVRFDTGGLPAEEENVAELLARQAFEEERYFHPPDEVPPGLSVRELEPSLDGPEKLSQESSRGGDDDFWADRAAQEHRAYSEAEEEHLRPSCPASSVDGPSSLLSISDAARAAGVNRCTIQRKIKSGVLAMVGATGTRRISAAELARVFGPLKTIPAEVPQGAAPCCAALDALRLELAAAREREARLLDLLARASGTPQGV